MVSQPAEIIFIQDSVTPQKTWRVNCTHKILLANVYGVMETYISFSVSLTAVMGILNLLDSMSGGLVYNFIRSYDAIAIFLMNGL